MKRSASPSTARNRLFAMIRRSGRRGISFASMTMPSSRPKGWLETKMSGPSLGTGAISRRTRMSRALSARLASSCGVAAEANCREREHSSSMPSALLSGPVIRRGIGKGNGEIRLFVSRSEKGRKDGGRVAGWCDMFLLLGEKGFLHVNLAHGKPVPASIP